MRIAVVGSGIAGLAAARSLAHEHDVTLFERQSDLGGHTYTVPVEVGGETHQVDMGFIVFNRHNYPGFSAMLEALGVASQPTDMSFSVSDPNIDLEYNATRLATLFAQKRNLVRPGFYRMVRDILRFYREAPALLEMDDPDLTIGQYLADRGYSTEFRDWHLLPITQALWSSPRIQAAEFPATALAGFMANHRMLQVDERPEWRVVEGGSRRYVEAWEREFLGPLGGLIERDTVVDGVERTAGAPVLHSQGRCLPFDRVILACHSDQALSLLDAPTKLEAQVLGDIRYQPNQVDLHIDERMLPERRNCWAAWNMMVPRGGSTDLPGVAAPVSVTYSMNILQGIRSSAPLSVTLNRRDDIDPAKLLHSVDLAHPVFDPAMIRAQRRWREIDGEGGVHFCGAYWGFGFHEDGHRSGLRAAARASERARRAA
jgi:predicted NAD/FAD-binding protein